MALVRFGTPKPWLHTNWPISSFIELTVQTETPLVGDGQNQRNFFVSLTGF
jgi:hypothetical protein